MKIQKMIVNVFVAAVCSAACSMTALGHEFWLDLSKYSAKPGDVVMIRTMVGDGFPGESRPRDPTKLDTFELVDSAGARPIMGVDGSEPMGIVRAQSAGTYVVAYRSKNTRVVLAGEKFEKYLKDKGLDNATAAREKAGTQATDGRERFSRCAKAILTVGEDRGSGFDKVMGYPIELCADSHPCAAMAGEELVFTVRENSTPTANVLVEAVNRDDPKVTLTARSDAQGKVKFKFEKKGLWRLNAVKIVPVDEKGGDCDWESYWASLTFDLRASSGAPVSAPVAQADAVVPAAK